MIQQITREELNNWEAEQRDFQLIDVREAIEHEAFNIGGILIPLADILRQRERILTDRPVVFYCKKGIRSQIAIQKLQRYFPEASFFNLQNGIGLGPA